MNIKKASIFIIIGLFLILVGIFGISFLPKINQQALSIMSIGIGVLTLILVGTSG